MEPITRKEKYLAAIVGQAVELPEPITREEMFLAEIANKGTGGGGGGSGNPNAVLYTPQTLTAEQQKQARDNVGAWPIIDVIELPSEENMRKDCIYRVPVLTFLLDGASLEPWTCHAVEKLPENPFPVLTVPSTSLEKSGVVAYYLPDDTVHGFVDEATGVAFGVSAGWYPFADLMAVAGVDYGGLTDSIAIAMNKNSEIYLFKDERLYVKSARYVKNDYYFDRRYPLATYWQNGDGAASLQAEGSHAVGSGAIATGIDSSAKGFSSFAHGANCYAGGDFSTVFGEYSSAGGNCAFAAGHRTVANGDFSAAIGLGLRATGNCQAVFGRKNKDDSDGKYVFIIGNGKYSDDDMGSTQTNAHTLDWDGVPWYQGRPQFGGNAQDDGSQTVMANGDTEIFLTSPNGTRFRITVSDDGVLSATAV